ncbi:MAG: serine/threonine-protein kinase RsbW [Arenicella sp.]
MTDFNPQRLISISSQLAQTGLVADALMAFTKQADVPDVSSSRMQLAVIEWLNNVIMYGDAPYSLIAIRFVTLGQTLSVIISDQNPALSSDFLEQPHECPDPLDLPEGGWGMHIIRSIVDRIELKPLDQGNELTLHLDY